MFDDIPFDDIGGVSIAGGELDNSGPNQRQGGLTGPSFRLSFIETKFH